YMELTGRPTEMIELVDAYTREQGFFHTPDSEEPTFSDTLELDLGSVVPSIAGPKRPQDRIALSDAKPAFLEALQEFCPGAAQEKSEYDKTIADSFPASDPPGDDHEHSPVGEPVARPPGNLVTAPCYSSDKIHVKLADGTEFDLDHGSVVIAAITSCTNASNPYVMIGAGLLARNALARGL